MIPLKTLLIPIANKITGTIINPPIVETAESSKRPKNRNIKTLLIIKKYKEKEISPKVIPLNFECFTKHFFIIN